MKVLLFFPFYILLAFAVNYYQRKSSIDRFIADLEKQKETAKEVNMDSKIDDIGQKYLGENSFFTLYTNVTYLLRQILYSER